MLCTRPITGARASIVTLDRIAVDSAGAPYVAGAAGHGADA